MMSTFIDIICLFYQWIRLRIKLINSKRQDISFVIFLINLFNLFILINFDSL